jgi:hypothetical protein
MPVKSLTQCLGQARTHACLEDFFFLTRLSIRRPRLFCPLLEWHCQGTCLQCPFSFLYTSILSGLYDISLYMLTRLQSNLSSLDWDLGNRTQACSLFTPACCELVLSFVCKSHKTQLNFKLIGNLLFLITDVFRHGLIQWLKRSSQVIQ